MRGLRSRHLLPLALCVGSIAMVGCPKMPRVSALDPTPTASASTSATPSASPSPTPSPSATPADMPTRRVLLAGAAPRGIAVDASGNGFVTLADDVVQLSMAVGDFTAVATASLKSDTRTFTSPAGIVLLGSGTVAWFTDGTQLRAYTPAQDTVDDFPFGGAPSRLAVDAQNNLWFTDAGSPRIGAIPAGSPLGTTPLALSLTAMPVDLLVDVTGTGWALCSQGGAVRIAKISRTLSGSTLTDLELDFDLAVTGLSQAAGIAIDPAGGIWITGATAGGLGQLIKLDRESGSPVTVIDLDFVPGRLALRGDFAWVADATSLKKISLSTHALVDTQLLGGKAAEVFKDAEQDLWIPVSNSNTVIKLDF